MLCLSCVNGAHINAFSPARNLGAAVTGPLQVVEMDVVINPGGIDVFVEAEKQAAVRSASPLKT